MIAGDMDFKGILIGMIVIGAIVGMALGVLLWECGKFLIRHIGVVWN